MEVHFAVAKVGKYAASESGDTLEMIERPHGGLSMVLADGQRSGRGAKAISNVVARKVIQLLAEGVRDGAAARAAHDYLYTYRGGKVSAELVILSVDAVTKTFVISRNSDVPVFIYTSAAGIFALDEPSQRVGIYRNTKPAITEIPIEAGTVIVVSTDGLRQAGSLVRGQPYDTCGALQRILAAGVSEAQEIADTLLQGACEMDDGRPRDDISILVVTVKPRQGDGVRRLEARLPL